VKGAACGPCLCASAQPDHLVLLSLGPCPFQNLSRGCNPQVAGPHRSARIQGHPLGAVPVPCATKGLQCLREPWGLQATCAGLYVFTIKRAASASCTLVCGDAEAQCFVSQLARYASGWGSPCSPLCQLWSTPPSAAVRIYIPLSIFELFCTNPTRCGACLHQDCGVLHCSGCHPLVACAGRICCSGEHTTSLGTREPRSRGRFGAAIQSEFGALAGRPGQPQACTAKPCNGTHLGGAE
jgi:hypothetical protein